MRQTEACHRCVRPVTSVLSESVIILICYYTVHTEHTQLSYVLIKYIRVNGHCECGLSTLMHDDLHWLVIPQ